MPSPPDPDAVPVISLDDWDDNVWTSSASSSHHPNFTSSLKITPSPTRSSHSLHRRRTSEKTNATSRPRDPWGDHDSQAESSDSATARGHPLKRDLGTSSSPVFNDPTVTRPILNLRLSPGPTVDADKDPFEVEQGVDTGSGERDELVLVHEVTATDSLQGVSLKYGISMTDLRKANQMWPSDSIHLRKSLNVPVNKASKLKQLNADAPVEAQEVNSSSSTRPLEITSDIRRIPASRLSFFPQGSSSDVSPADAVITDARRPRISRQFNSSGSGSLSISPSTNSSSIFSTLPRAFPIAKDAIMSRLSLDSGGTPPNEEQEHEMGVVGRNRSVDDTRARGSLQRRGAGVDSGTTSHTDDHGPRDGRQARARNYNAYRTGENEREHASAVIRTSQLEPSPEMLVPALGQKRVQWDQGSSL